jgi:succinate dehydrogenase / fumarate reductase membrane anchor subunit
MGKVLGLGSAKQGSGHWWAQRVTAAALVLLGIWLIAALAWVGSFDYDAIRLWIGHPLNATLLASFVAVSAHHSKLGVDVILEDYAHGPTKIALSLLSVFFHVVVGALGVIAVLRIAFGGAA